MKASLITAPGGTFRGEISVPGDKSISHRALLFGALAEGETSIAHFLASEDTQATIGCLRELGVRIDEGRPMVRVLGAGLHGFLAADRPLWTGNSGTTTRLMMGILAGQPYAITLEGDASLNRRPMDRVAIPLRQMGADVEGAGARCSPPVTVRGGVLRAIRYASPVASAQVKSAILLAGLYANGVTEVIEPVQSRDHTERMLRAFGVEVEVDGRCVRLRGGQSLRAAAVGVPGDISSAAFFLVAAAITPGASVIVSGVGINPTRDGIIEVLDRMGADIDVKNERMTGGEPVADIIVRHRRLRGVEIGGPLIPRLIDELPILAIAGAFADGVTVIRDASELRVKESDRIEMMTNLLRAMGAEVQPFGDGLAITGGKPLHGTVFNCHHDHRIAMSAAVAGLAAGVRMTIPGAETIASSFPTFVPLMQQLGAKLEMLQVDETI